MNADRAALVAGILASPEDDAPRLVCADWFQEQGDESSVARAEFIRIQIERTNLSPTDPRQSELEARELRLLKQFGAVWTGSHFAFKKCRFHRGFIEYVHLHLKHFLHHRRQLLALEPVNDISLTGWVRSPPHLYDRLAACEEWKHIEALNFEPQGSHHGAGPDVLRVLESPHLTRLRSLVSSRAEFDDPARRRFERLPVLQRVRHLVLPAPWRSCAVAAAQHWDGLRSLFLHNAAHFETLEAFTQLPFWERLTRLSWGFSNAPVELELLRRRVPPGLRSVQLFAADFSTAESCFARLADAPLRRVFLAGMHFTPSALGGLFSERASSAIRELTFHIAPITVEHARVLVSAPKAPHLRRLLLAGTDCDPRAVEMLLDSGHLNALTHLALSGGQITDAVLNTLAKSELGVLRSLSLGGVSVTERGLASFLDSPSAQNLVRLTVTAAGTTGTRLEITPALVRRLTALPHLSVVCLGASALGAEARSILLESDTVVSRQLYRPEETRWEMDDPLPVVEWSDGDED